MPTSDKGNQSDSPRSDYTINRRSVLKATGAGSVASVAGLAGCLGGAGGGEDDTIRIGISGPMSGPLAHYGEMAATGIPLAIDHAREEDDTNGMEIELVDTLDSENNPTQTIDNMNQFAEEGVDFVNGFLGGVTTLPAGRVGQENGILVHGNSGPLPATGEECKPMLFAIAQTIPQQASAGISYVLREGMGSRVYQIGNDNDWGNDHMEFAEQSAIPDGGGEHMDTAIVPNGTTNFSQYLTEARDMETDILYLALDPPGYISVLNEAMSNGMLDDGLTVAMATVTLATGSEIPDIFANYDVYSAKEWYWNLGAGETEKFTEAHREETGAPPQQFAAHYYASTRTVLSAFGEAETTDTEEVRQILEGYEITPQLWGIGETFRACDHRGTLPPITVTGLAEDERDVENGHVFDVVEVQDDVDEFMIPCEETGCDMPE